MCVHWLRKVFARILIFSSRKLEKKKLLLLYTQKEIETNFFISDRIISINRNETEYKEEEREPSKRLLENIYRASNAANAFQKFDSENFFFQFR